MPLKCIRRQSRFPGFTGNVLLHICLKLYTVALVFEQIQSMTLHKAWVEQHWCKSIAKPHWPLSYQRNLHEYSLITKSTEAFVVAESHGFSNGDFVLFTGEKYMTEILGNVYQVRESNASGFL